MKTPRSLRRLGSSLLIGGQAITATMRGRINTVDLSDQLMEAGPGSLLIVLIISIAAGSVFNIQVAAELTRQGAGSTVGGILAIGLAREIAPLLTACLLAGKVATAYAAQLGTMKVTEQIDAITMRVHERGAGITQACGTGACAAAEAALVWGLVPRSAEEVLVHMDGGDVQVRVNEPKVGSGTLIGPAQFMSKHVVEISL